MRVEITLKKYLDNKGKIEKLELENCSTTTQDEYINENIIDIKVGRQTGGFDTYYVQFQDKVIREYHPSSIIVTLDLKLPTKFLK